MLLRCYGYLNEQLNLLRRNVAHCLDISSMHQGALPSRHGPDSDYVVCFVLYVCIYLCIFENPKVLPNFNIEHLTEI